MRIAVLTAAAGGSWEAALVTAVGDATLPIAIARRCVDVTELLAVAASGQGQVALVAAELRHLDADAIDRLLAADVVPVGVVARADIAAEQRLRASGIEYVVPSDAAADVVASVVVEARAAHVEHPPSAGAFADPLASLPVPHATDVLDRAAGSAQTPAPGHSGVVLAVWGPTGGPGRTTVATTLADEFARLGSATLLVDADVYGGTVAPVLGLLDESPGLAAACRIAGTTRLDAAALVGLCWQIRPSLRALTGIPLAHRWPEIRASAIAPVLAAARSIAEVVVVDCGFALETDEEISYDSLAPRRNGATLALLDAADQVLAVGAADPIGVQRLIRGLAELREAGIGTPVSVVVNKVRRGVVPGDSGREVGDALQRFAGYSPVALLPYDRDGIDAALATGRLLGEMRPSSPLRKAVAALAAALSAGGSDAADREPLAARGAPTARHRRPS